MSLVYEVYSYWNIQELQGAFNAIASLTNSANFTGLLRVLALIAILSLALAVLAGRARHEDFWRWVVMVALVNGMMLVPKANVILVDKTGTEPNQTVANVPIGLAFLAHGTSRIGDWLTRAYETVFSLPNDLQFQKRGLMFGHRILEETQLMSTDMVSGTWQRDFQEYMRECVAPDLISGYLSIDTLRNSTNLWAALGNTNPALYVTLSTLGTVQCAPTAYNDLTNRLNNAVVPAIITSHGLKLFPGDPLANAKTQNAIVTAYSHGLGVASTATEIVKQAAVQTAFVQAYCGLFAQAGDSNRAALCYSVGMGAYQTNQTYQVLAKIAESSMPKLKAAIEIIQYSVFPIILAFAIVAGHLSIRVLKTYGLSLIWIQLWPPLYAVVHYIMTVKMQMYQNALGAAAATLQGSGQLVSMAVSDQAVAGMLVVAIPPIAAALVKGGEVGLQAVAGLVSAPRTAERQAADTAKGNESVGQWKTAGVVDYSGSPTPVMAHRNADGSYTYTHPDGSTTFNVGTALDKASSRASTSGRESIGASIASEKAEAAAVSELVSGSRTFGASIQRGIEFARTHLKEQGNETRWSVDNASEVAKAAETAQNIQNNYLKENGVNERLHTAIKGTAAVIAGTPELLNKVSPVQLEASLAAELGSETDAAIVAKHATGLARTQGYSEAVRAVAKATRSDAFSEAEKSSTGAKDSVQALTNEGLQRVEQSAANFQRSLAFKELAQRAKEGEVKVDQDLTTLVMNRFATERFQTADGVIHDGMSKEEIDYRMRVKNDPVVRRMFEQFANEATARYLEENYGGKMHSKEDVQAFFDEGKGVVPSKENIDAQGSQWKQDPASLARNAGVDPKTQVTDNRSIKGQVGNQQSAAAGAINTQQTRVTQDGSKIEGDVRNKTDKPPSYLGMFGTTTLNGASALGSSGFNWGADQLMGYAGIKPEASFWRKDVDQYQGGWAGFAFDTGLMLLGGPVGRVAGGAAAKVLGSGAGKKAAKEVLEENATTAVGYNFPNHVVTVANQAKQEVVDKALEIGSRAGIPIGVAAAGELADKTRDSVVNNLDGALDRGERAAGDLFSGSPGGSNWGSLLGGGQPPAQSQSQQTEGSGGAKKDDTPPPSGR